MRLRTTPLTAAAALALVLSGCAAEDTADTATGAQSTGEGSGDSCVLEEPDDPAMSLNLPV